MQPDEDTQELESRIESAVPEQMVDNTVDEQVVQSTLPLHSPTFRPPANGPSSRSTSPVAPGGLHFAEDVCPDTACDNETIPEDSSPPRTPKHAGRSSILTTPAGVAKRHTRPRNKCRVQNLQNASPTSVVPSEEDLLYVLMHRYRQRGEAANRSMTKIKTLEHRNFELHAQHEDLHKQRDDALASAAEANEKYGLLQTNVEDFKAKYSKVKRCARASWEGMVALREHTSVRDEVFQELRQLGEEVNASLRDVKSGVQVAQKTLKTEKAVLSAVRSEALVAASESAATSQDLLSATKRIKELTREKNRFEANIISLQHAQQNLTHEANQSNQDVGKTLARMNNRLDGIERAALYPSLVPATVDECLKLLQSIAQEKQATTEELEKLSKSVSDVERGIAQGVKSVRESFVTLQRSDQTKQEREVMKQLAELEQLKQYVANTHISAEQSRHFHTERAKLQNHVEGLQNLIEELRKSNSQSESHAATFQQGMATLAASSNTQQPASPNTVEQLRSNAQQLKTQLNVAKSDLVTTKKQLEDCEKNFGGEIAGLKDEKANLEGRLKNADAAHSEKLREGTRSLTTEVHPTCLPSMTY